jgi:hypothetical protein
MIVPSNGFVSFGAATRSSGAAKTIRWTRQRNNATAELLRAPDFLDLLDARLGRTV